MTPRLPKTVRLSGRTWKIEEAKDLIESHEVFGFCYRFEQRVQIDQCLHLEQKQEIVLHELLHGLDDIHRLYLTEEQVQHIAISVLALLKDNPRLTTYLTHDAH